MARDPHKPRSRSVVPTRQRLHYGSSFDHSVVRTRLMVAGLSVIAVSLFGSVGYWLIGKGEWSWLDCVYMVLITITSVGYAEVLPVANHPQARMFTMMLLVGGMGVSFYFLSALTAFIIEGDLREALWKRRVYNRLMKFNGHLIVCGTGRTGVHVAEELFKAGKQVVVIDRDKARLDELASKHGDSFIGLLGDATDDDVLRDAGVERASGLVTALQQDQDNLFVALSARQLNPNLRIVSRANDDRVTPKLRQAGVDVAVSPTHIGGRRMAHELLQPNMVGFIDLMARDYERNLNIEEIVLRDDSPLVGKTLATSQIRQVSNALVLAVIDGDSHTYNPPHDFVLAHGMKLIVLGERNQLQRLILHAQKGAP